MRCPKCGRIDFDHLDSCRKCGADLSQVREQLGEFSPPNTGLNWFELLRGGRAQEAPSQAPRLGSLDVSDIASPAPPVEQEEVVELSPEDLKEAAASQELDRALDGLLGSIEEE